MSWKSVLGCDIEREAGKDFSLLFSYFFLYISIELCFQIEKGRVDPMIAKETEF